MRVAARSFNPWTVAAVAILGLAAFLAWRMLAPGGPLEVTVVNGTPDRLDGLALVSGSGVRTPIPDLAPDDSATVRPRFSEDGDRLMLADAGGGEYGVLDWFEGDPGGQVTIIIRSVSTSGLEGRVVASPDYLDSGETPLEPLGR